MIVQDFPYAVNINRDFRLAFDAYLAGKQIHPNGHAHAPLRPMRGQAFVKGTVRAMLEWASDPEGGNLLPETFRNPFRRLKESRDVFKGDVLAEPRITLPMAVAFVEGCDCFQLRLFVPLIVFGLRAAEPCLLFRDHLDADWLRVCCIPELVYFSKGRRDKRFPLVAELQPFWDLLRDASSPGLLCQRRAVVEGRELAPFRQACLAELIREFQARCVQGKPWGSTERVRLREQLLRQAGALNYDHIEQEFRQLTGRLRWPAQVTLKDFRHGFATMLGNTSMAEAYKKYLLGHAPVRAALNAYTHLTQLREQFQTSINQAWPALIDSIRRRSREV
jgi:integrase